MLDEMLRTKHVIVCTGAGGVGKTTASAALALRAADLGRRVIVCTIDPARRLAQSMGLAELDNIPHRVPVSLKDKRGELFAMMLDMKRTFDEMVQEMASGDRAEQILDNPFYKHVSGTLAGTQEYMAMEKLWELHEEGGWELIVVDTPPTRSALDFLDAPRRLTDFLEGRFLKLMLWPYMKAGKGGLKVINLGTQVALRAVTRITGSELFGDVAAFFASFEGMYADFKNRAVRVRELMQAPRTSFVVVTAPTSPSLREARFFAERLRSEGMPLGGLIVNRTHPAPITIEDPAGLAARAEGVLAHALIAYEQVRALGEREQLLLEATVGELGRAPVWQVPELTDEVTDLKALRHVGSLIANGALP